MIDSKSKWFVGSSKINTFALESINLDNIQRTFSPPERTVTCFITSSPENNIRPKKLRKNVLSCSSTGAYWRNHSKIFKFSFENSSVISFGKYAWLVVTPHLNVPLSASISPVKILNNVVIAISERLKKATLSSFDNWKLTFSKMTSPSIVFDKPSTNNKSLPISRAGENPTNGYLRLEGWISSNVILSNIFLREVACFDLEAFAEKRAINSCNSLIFSSFFAFWSANNFAANWLECNQKS